MKVIQFPPAKDPLAFDGMGMKIDIEQQRESWSTTFIIVQTAARFCNFNHVKAEETVRNSLAKDGGWFIDKADSNWADTIDYLEAVIAIMKAALARLEISKDRVLVRTKRKGK